jgi:hypothetical protein
VSAIVQAISMFQTVDSLVNPQVRHFEWYWAALAVIGFGVFAYLVYWGWYSEYRKAKGFENAQPDIVATPSQDLNGFQLQIKNIGGKGVFHAKAQRIVDWQPKGSEWLMMWAGRFDKSVTILKGDSEKLSIALPSYSEGNIPHITLLIPVVTDSGSFTDDRNSGNNEISLTLKVKIFADPELKHPFEKTYKIERVDTKLKVLEVTK